VAAAIRLTSTEFEKLGNPVNDVRINRKISDQIPAYWDTAPIEIPESAFRRQDRLERELFLRIEGGIELSF